MQFGLATAQNVETSMAGGSLKSAIEAAEQSKETITEAYGPYKFGMSEKEFVKATKAAIKEKKATRNSIGNVEFVNYFPDGRTYSVILANAVFYQDKLCGLDFVFERFDSAISDIILNEIMQADRFAEMDKYTKTDGITYIKDNPQVDLSRGSISYVNAPVVNQKAKENMEKNTGSRRAF